MYPVGFIRQVSSLTPVTEVQEMSQILKHGQTVMIRQTDKIKEIPEMDLQIYADNNTYLHVSSQ
jgi:hypothetical protein